MDMLSACRTHNHVVLPSMHGESPVVHLCLQVRTDVLIGYRCERNSDTLSAVGAQDLGNYKAEGQTKGRGSHQGIGEMLSPGSGRMSSVLTSLHPPELPATAGSQE